MPRFTESDQKMSFQDRKALEGRFKSMVVSSSQKELDLGEDGILFPEKMQESKRISTDSIRLKRVLEKDEALSHMSDSERVRLEARRGWIADHLKKSAPSYKEIHRTMKTSGGADFERSVQKVMYWQSAEVVTLLEEWKDITRKLDPQNPLASDVSVLGSTKSVHYLGGGKSAFK